MLSECIGLDFPCIRTRCCVDLTAPGAEAGCTAVPVVYQGWDPLSLGLVCRQNNIEHLFD
eukprot:5685775-Amphidinium_carterae.1